MQRGSRLLQILSSSTAVLITLCLFVSFGLHSVQVKHEHSKSHTHADGAPAHHHDKSPETTLTLHDQFHKNEEKLFLFIILSVITFGFAARPEFLNTGWQHYVTRLYHIVRTILWRQPLFTYRTYLEHLFQRGILNPKLF